MADASDIHGTVFKDGSATFLARVIGADGTRITRSDLASAVYGVYLLEEDDPDAAIAVVGHEGVSISPSSLVFDTLQNDSLWDIDQSGYNFKHVLDISTNQAFSVAGRTYRIVFELAPTVGQPILVRFRVHAI